MEDPYIMERNGLASGSPSGPHGMGQQMEVIPKDNRHGGHHRINGIDPG